VAAGWPWVWQASRGSLFGPVLDDGRTDGLEAIAVALPYCLAGLVCAVLGHTFSVFTRFKGGKGVATASGGLVVLMPLPILIGAAVWFGIFFTWRYVSLASILGVIAAVGAAWALGLPLTLKVVATLVGGWVIVRHQSNVRRLLAGTENRFGRKPEEEK
jgi:glycerol-3-phosphate acyltransferase PlsY